jgi:polyisoprenoid-binding protein YceI
MPAMRRLVLSIALVCARLAAAQEMPHAVRYRFVPEKSDLHFELPTTLHLVAGKVPDWTGEIEVDPAQPGVLHARIAIKAVSIVTGSKGRDANMHRKVLECSAFPEIVFQAATYKGDLGKLSPGRSFTTEIAGDLTIHGVTLPVQTSIECEILADHAIIAGAVPVHWKDFRLLDMSRIFNKVRDPMTVIFRLWAEPEGRAR